MEELTQRIWYLAYGSNICLERFLYYILGGHLNGTDYPGCQEDPKLPLRSRRALVNHKVVFNKYAFMTTRPGYTYCRLYRISKAQFKMLYLQENGVHSPVEDIDSKIEEVKQDPFANYSHIMKLGTYKDDDIVTFTRPDSLAHRGAYIDYLECIESALTRIYDSKQIEKQISRMKTSRLPERLGKYEGITIDGLKIDRLQLKKSYVRHYMSRLDREAKEKRIVLIGFEKSKKVDQASDETVLQT
jgi:hypothetical protein